MKAIVLLLLARAGLGAQQQEPQYKFSTTVAGEPLYTFGTTVVASSGFRGNIYFLEPGTLTLPNFEKLKPVGTVYTPCLNVPYQEFSVGFPGVTDRVEWFAIDYHAKFWVSRAGRYYFALVSDDGSILYVDDKAIIDNDGQHGILRKDGNVKLGVGVHRIRVSYFQGPRYHLALMLAVEGPKDKAFRIFHSDEFKPPADAPYWDEPESAPVRRKR